MIIFLISFSVTIIDYMLHWQKMYQKLFLLLWINRSFIQKSFIVLFSSFSNVGICLIDYM